MLSQQPSFSNVVTAILEYFSHPLDNVVLYNVFNAITEYRDWIKSVHQVWWISFLLLLITSASISLQHSWSLVHRLKPISVLVSPSLYWCQRICGIFSTLCYWFYQNNRGNSPQHLTNVVKATAEYSAHPTVLLEFALIVYQALSPCGQFLMKSFQRVPTMHNIQGSAEVNAPGCVKAIGEWIYEFRGLSLGWRNPLYEELL